METVETERSNEEERAESIETVVDEEEEFFFQDIYMLIDHGIANADVEEMRKMGINTIRGFQMTMPSKLLGLKDFDQAKIDKILDICSRISFSDQFMTAREVGEQRKQVFKIGTGSSNLDKLLGGGIESMSVTQVFGMAGAGKTQLAHTISVVAQIPTEDYCGGKVMFIDTENTFRPERIRQVARRFKLAEDGVLDNILYARAYNSHHQHLILKKVRARFHEEPGIFKLLIVDSIMALLRVDFSGTKDLLSRQQKLGQMMSLLAKISEEFNIAVFITNQITSELKKVDLLSMDADGKPVGGNILAHACTTTVGLKKIGGNVRIAKLCGSPEQEETEEAFVITTGGIRDPKIPD